MEEDKGETPCTKADELFFCCWKVCQTNQMTNLDKRNVYTSLKTIHYCPELAVGLLSFAMGLI